MADENGSTPQAPAAPASAAAKQATAPQSVTLRTHWMTDTFDAGDGLPTVTKAGTQVSTDQAAAILEAAERAHVAIERVS